MGSAVAKDENGRAVAPRVRAMVIDALEDQVTVRIDVSDELLGALVRDRSNYFVASIAGAEWREALRRLAEAA